MQNKVMRTLQCAVLLIGFVWKVVPTKGSQTISSSPDASAGVQYVAPICSGGVPCMFLNDGLSPGSAKWDTDAGKAIDDAYAALPPTGGVIYVASLGGCSNFSTPIELTTQGKYVIIIGTGVATTCLNYTPSTGTALTLATGNLGVGHDDLENFSLRTITEGSRAIGLVIGQNGVAAEYATLPSPPGGVMSPGKKPMNEPIGALPVIGSRAWRVQVAVRLETSSEASTATTTCCVARRSR